MYFTVNRIFNPRKVTALQATAIHLKKGITIIREVLVSDTDIVQVQGRELD